MSDKASVRPWRIEREDGDKYIRDAGGYSLFCDMPYYPWCSPVDADWELIVAAVNAYEAHQRAAQALRRARGIIEDEMCCDGDCAGPDCEPCVLCSVRAALAELDKVTK